MELANHAEKVMCALDEGIKGLDDMDVFLTCLHQVGATHTKIPGFNPQYFWVSSLKLNTSITHLNSYMALLNIKLIKQPATPINKSINIQFFITEYIH